MRKGKERNEKRVTPESSKIRAAIATQEIFKVLHKKGHKHRIYSTGLKGCVEYYWALAVIDRVAYNTKHLRILANLPNPVQKHICI